VTSSWFFLSTQTTRCYKVEKS